MLLRSRAGFFAVIRSRTLKGAVAGYLPKIPFRNPRRPACASS